MTAPRTSSPLVGSSDRAIGRRLFSWLAILAMVLALAWWQRGVVAPVIVRYLPSTAPVLAWIQPTAQSAEGATGGERRGTGGGRRGGGRDGAPLPVVLAKAEMKALPITIEAVGTIEAHASIQLRPRIDGQIVGVTVEEGSRVNKGDVLFVLDDQAIRAQLAGVEATIAKDKAQIEQAQRDLARASELLASRAGSPVQRETTATALKVAQAQLAADEAQRASIQTSLSYTQIRAPVSGRVGAIPAKPGALVRAADTTPLTTINEVDPAIVSFAIPQTRLTEVRAAMANGPVKVEVESGAAKGEGAVTFLDNAIDPATGTIIVKAEIGNGAEVFWPGAFARAKILLEAPRSEVTVPVAALQIGQKGSFVFVVKEIAGTATATKQDGSSAQNPQPSQRRPQAGEQPREGSVPQTPTGKAELRIVTVSRTVGPDAILSSGVSAGEAVVVEGQLRLVDGAPVVEKPSADAASSPRSVEGPNG